MTRFGSRRMRTTVAALSSALVLAATAPTTLQSSAPASPADAQGRGWLEKAVCVGCAGAIIGLGGSSLVGLAIIAGTMPEAVAGCALACAVGFGGE